MMAGRLQSLLEDPHYRVGELCVIAAKRPWRTDAVMLGQIPFDLLDLLASLDHSWMFFTVELQQRLQLGTVFEELLFEGHTGVLVAVAQPHRFQKHLLAEGVLDRHQALANVPAVAEGLNQRLV